jgi:hypothetical protein
MTTPSEQIDKQIAGLADWRGQTMVHLRKIINEADSSLKEEWKWGTPVWTSQGNVCALGAFKDHVKINFFKGASLSDPQGLFNGGLDAKASRSIDLREGDAVNEQALAQLIRAAITHNTSKP